MRQRCVAWQDGELQAVVESHVRAMLEDLDARAKAFLKDLDDVRAATIGWR